MTLQIQRYWWIREWLQSVEINWDAQKVQPLLACMKLQLQLERQVLAEFCGDLRGLGFRWCRVHLSDPGEYTSWCAFWGAGLCSVVVLLVNMVKVKVFFLWFGSLKHCVATPWEWNNDWYVSFWNVFFLECWHHFMFYVECQWQNQPDSPEKSFSQNLGLKATTQA